MGEGSDEVIDSLHSELDELTTGLLLEDPTVYFKELRWFQSQMNHRLSPILISQLEDEEAEKQASESPDSFREFLKPENPTSARPRCSKDPGGRSYSYCLYRVKCHRHPHR